MTTEAKPKKGSASKASAGKKEAEKTASRQREAVKALRAAKANVEKAATEAKEKAMAVKAQIDTEENRAKVKAVARLSRMKAVKAKGKAETLFQKARTKAGEVVMVLVCNGFIDGSPETQKALLDKMEGYLNHTQSEEFQKEYGGWPVILRVTLGREPDEHILALLSKCPAWAADYGVKLEIEIGGKQVRIVES